MRLVPCTVACWLVASLCYAQQAPPAPTTDAPAASARREPAPPVSPNGEHPASGSVPTEDKAGNPGEPGAGQPGGHASPVPEPSTLFLVGTGLVGVALTVRRRPRRATT